MRDYTPDVLVKVVALLSCIAQRVMFWKLTNQIIKSSVRTSSLDPLSQEDLSLQNKLL